MADLDDKDAETIPLEKLEGLATNVSPEKLREVQSIITQLMAQETRRSERSGASSPSTDASSPDLSQPKDIEGGTGAQNPSPSDSDPAIHSPSEKTKDNEKAKAKALKALHELIESCWSTTLAEQLGELCEPCRSLPLRPLTLGIVECPANLASKIARALKGETYEEALGVTCSTIVHDVETISKRKVSDTGSKMRSLVQSEMLNGNAVVLCAKGNLSPGVIAMASWTVRLEDVNPRILSFARLMRAKGHPLDLVDGTPFEDRWPSDRRVPYDRVKGVGGWLEGVLVAGKPIDEDTFGRLEDIVGKQIDVSPGIAPGGPRNFEDVPGLHPTTRSRLATLVARMRESTDSPPGILLCGPPGTGKTMLAGLVAKGTGRTFVETSATEWVAASHLGETLAMMRSKFAEAREKAPSILFIDELDTMGRRGGDDKNEQWTRMFINGLLECLQGLGGRGDVAVVAATNHLASIDPAIVREGRIGEHIEVPLPNRNGRREVLDFYLPEPLRKRVDTLLLADRVGPCSPAKIRALAEETILQAKGEATPEDLERALASMAGQLTKGHDPASLALPICSGLAGEAIMIALAYGDQAHIDGISSRPGLADLGRVSVTYRGRESAPSATVGDLRRRLHVAMAPAIARRIVAIKLAQSGRALQALDAFSPVTAGEQFVVQAQAENLVLTGHATMVMGSVFTKDAAVAVEVSNARKLVRRTLVRCEDALLLLTHALVRGNDIGAAELSELLGFDAASASSLPH